MFTATARSTFLDFLRVSGAYSIEALGCYNATVDLVYERCQAVEKEIELAALKIEPVNETLVLQLNLMLLRQLFADIQLAQSIEEFNHRARMVLVIVGLLKDGDPNNASDMMVGGKYIISPSAIV